MNQELSHSDNTSSTSVWARWAVQYAVHRRLLREDPAYRRQYTILTFVLIIYPGLSLAEFLIAHRLGVTWGVVYLLLLSVALCWLVIKGCIFINRRVSAALHGSPPA